MSNVSLTPCVKPAFRSASAADPRAFAALHAVVDPQIDHPADGQNLFKVDPDLPAKLAARITIASIDGEPVGAVASFLAEADGPAWIGSLAVSAKARGQGVATVLIGHAVDDRFAIDGRSLPLFAEVRVLKGGGLNVGSGRAFRANGFVASHVRRFRVADSGWRTAHLGATADPEGTVRTLIFVKITPLAWEGL